MAKSMASTLLGKTIFGASLAVFALFFTAKAVAAGEVSPETALRAAIATAGTLGTGSYSCNYEMETAPIEIAPAPGKFQFSALSITMKKPATIEGAHGHQEFNQLKLMFLEEPKFEKFFVQNSSGQPVEFSKATFDVVAKDMKPLKLEIVLDGEGKLVRMTAFESVSFLDGRPAQLRAMFGCN